MPRPMDDFMPHCLLCQHGDSKTPHSIPERKGQAARWFRIPVPEPEQGRGPLLLPKLRRLPRQEY